MCEELALKFGTTDPERLLGVLPVDEVVEVIRARLRLEMEAEISEQYKDRIYDAEEEASDAEGRAESWQCDAVGLYRGIEKALGLPWEEAKAVLRESMADYGGDID